MRKSYLLISFISLTTLVACNNGPAPIKVTYEELYAKSQEIEDHRYSKATLTCNAFVDVTQGGETYNIDKTMTFNYVWDEEQNRFVSTDEEEAGFSNDISKTIKELLANHPEEPEDYKDVGCQYFISPFRTYVDYTETIEERTLRTIEEKVFDKYGYLTYYKLEVTVQGIFQEQEISGVERTTYSVIYQD